MSGSMDEIIARLDAALQTATRECQQARAQRDEAVMEWNFFRDWANDLEESFCRMDRFCGFTNDSTMIAAQFGALASECTAMLTRIREHQEAERGKDSS